MIGGTLESSFDQSTMYRGSTTTLPNYSGETDNLCKIKKRTRNERPDDELPNDDHVGISMSPSCPGIKRHQFEKTKPRFISNLRVATCIPTPFITSLKSDRKITDFYEFSNPPKLLGQGAMSIVFAAKNRVTGCDVAIKAMIKADIYKRTTTFEEYDILTSLNQSHPSIINMIDAFETENDLYLVMELCSGGDLFEFVRQRSNSCCFGSNQDLVNGNGLTEHQVVMITSQLLSAIDFLHSNRGIVHRDVKLENILISRDKDNIWIKLADFGIAKSLEKLPCHERERIGASFMSSDMYSIGLCLFYMLAMSSPCLAQDNKIDFTFISNQEKTKTSMDTHQLLQSLTTYCSDAAIDLLTRLLHPKAQHRLSAAEALDHSWIKSR